MNKTKVKTTVVLGGNNILSVNISEYILSRSDIFEVLAFCPEDNDTYKNVDWERSFYNYCININKELQLPLFLGNINQYFKEITDLKPDLLVLSRCKRLIKKCILDIPRIGVTNLHYGLLPKYGGCNVTNWAILRGEKTVGITLHLMSENIDEGPIIDQVIIDINKKERIVNLTDKSVLVKGLTAFEIYLECNNAAFLLFKKNIDNIINNITLKKQDLEEKLYFPKTALNFKTDLIVHSDVDDNETICRKIRAFTFPYFQVPSEYYNNEFVGKINILKPTNPNDYT